MKLVDILKELKWKQSTFEMCMAGMVPLSLPIVKKLVEPKREKTFHITDIKNLDKVASLQGKSKSISTFNKTDLSIGPASGDGMWTDGGVLVILSGIVLADSIWDLMSKPDESGRRWVSPEHVLFNDFAVKHKIIDFGPPQLKVLKKKWEETKELSKEEKQYFIKTYIDTAYKVMLKNKSHFQKKYFNSDYLYWQDDWNEVVLTKINIEAVAVLTDWGIPEEEIQKIKKKFKKVYLIKSSELPDFLDKQGVYVRGLKRYQ